MAGRENERKEGGFRHRMINKRWATTKPNKRASLAVLCSGVLALLLALPVPGWAAKTTELSSAACEKRINDSFHTLETSLAKLTRLEKELEPAGKLYITKAAYGGTLRRQLTEALDKLRTAASSDDGFEQSFQLLVERINAFDQAITVPPSKKDKISRTTLEASGSLEATEAGPSNKALGNVSVAIERFERSLSLSEQRAVVAEVAQTLEKELARVQELLSAQLGNVRDTIKAGAVFKMLVSDFNETDDTLKDAQNAIRKAGGNLEIANRRAKAPILVPEAFRAKLDKAELLASQGAIVANQGTTLLAQLVTHFDRRDKVVRSTILDVEKQVTAIESRHPGLLNMQRINILMALLILSGAILYYISHAQKGAKLFIRRIAGLSALDDAVGRATEMGRPILFVSGIKDVDDVQTLAGLSILSSVASKAAEYDTELFVPCCMHLAYSMAQEITREAYLKAGRPDAFNEDNVRYLTSDQFGFVAGVDGIMVREKVAACFYLGKFYAESLILAETGNSIGAIQIAGTAETAQLPFFVAACDYTLIGEELFAASAYLSGEPRLLGSLKGQDVGKAIMIVAVILGVFLQICISYGYLPESISVLRLFEVR